MKKVILSAMMLMAFVINVCGQNLAHRAYDTNGPVGECLFTEDSEGNIVYTGIVDCDLSADTIMGLAKEFLYSVCKKYDARQRNVLEGITKVACDLELKIGKRYLTLSNVWAGVIHTWEKGASTISFNMTIEIRKNKYRYTLSNFYTDRYRIPGEGKDNGPSNLLHWQRLNSLQKEYDGARKKSKEEWQQRIDFEKALYQAEYAAVQDVIEGLKTFAVIKDDF